MKEKLLVGRADDDEQPFTSPSMDPDPDPAAMGVERWLAGCLPRGAVLRCVAEELHRMGIVSVRDLREYLYSHAHRRRTCPEKPPMFSQTTRLSTSTMPTTHSSLNMRVDALIREVQEGTPVKKAEAKRLNQALRSLRPPERRSAPRAREHAHMLRHYTGQSPETSSRAAPQCQERKGETAPFTREGTTHSILPTDRCDDSHAHAGGPARREQGGQEGWKNDGRQGARQADRSCRVPGKKVRSQVHQRRRNRLMAEAQESLGVASQSHSDQAVMHAFGTLPSTDKSRELLDIRLLNPCWSQDRHLHFPEACRELTRLIHVARVQRSSGFHLVPLHGWEHVLSFLRLSDFAKYDFSHLDTPALEHLDRTKAYYHLFNCSARIRRAIARRYSLYL